MFPASTATRNRSGTRRWESLWCTKELASDAHQSQCPRVISTQVADLANRGGVTAQAGLFSGSPGYTFCRIFAVSCASASALDECN
jgi:hypothetical protein